MPFKRNHHHHFNAFFLTFKSHFINEFRNGLDSEEVVKVKIGLGKR